jgi:hypothetical protein
MSEQFLTLSETVVTRAYEAIQERWTASKQSGRKIATLPEPPSRIELGALLEQAFWASLQTEEGRAATFSLRWVAPPPEGFGLTGLVLEEPIRLADEAIRKLAPAMVFGSTSIGVTTGEQPGEAIIWGLSEGDYWGLEVRVVRPGFLTLEYSHERTVVFLGQEAWQIPRFSSARGLIESALPQSLGGAERTVAGAGLLSLTREMRRHGSGGALVFLPASAGDPGIWTNQNYKLKQDETTSWYAAADLVRLLDEALVKNWLPQEGVERSPLLEPLAHALAPYEVPGLRGLLTGDPHDMTPALALWATAVGKLTAVDGAVLLDDGLNVLSFGTRLLSDAQVEVRLLASGAVSRREPTELELHKIGGTRHESAVRFVNQVRGAVALVASHDGHFTIIRWDAERSAVLAYRNVHLLLD